MSWAPGTPTLRSITKKGTPLMPSSLGLGLVGADLVGEAVAGHEQLARPRASSSPTSTRQTLEQTSGSPTATLGEVGVAAVAP